MTPPDSDAACDLVAAAQDLSGTGDVAGTAAAMAEAPRLLPGRLEHRRAAT